MNNNLNYNLKAAKFLFCLLQEDLVLVTWRPCFLNNHYDIDI